MTSLLLTRHVASPLSFEEMVKYAQLPESIYLIESLVQNTVQEALNQCLERNLKNIIASTLFYWFSIKWRGPLEKIVSLELHLSKVSKEIIEPDPLKAEKLFQEKIKSPEGKNIIFKKYPVIAKKLANDSRKFQEFLLKILKDFEADSQELATLVGIKPFQKKNLLIEKISLLGDSHSDGKQVSLISFKNKENTYSLIYKPRDGALDRVMQKVYTWANTLLEHPLALTKILSKEDHHWAEYITDYPAKNKKDIEDFYVRFGYLTAISYIFYGMDLHFDNLIASKNQPIIVDHECFFSPIFESRSKVVLDKVTSGSSMLISLLDKTREFSALFGVTDFEGTLPSHERPRHTKNRLIYEKEAVNPLKYREYLKKGFAEAYKIFLENKDFLLGRKSSPLSEIGNIKIRLVFRQTELYDLLLKNSNHPRLLADEGEYLNHLNWVNVNKSNDYELEFSEIRQLLNDDIPIFYCNMHEKDIWDPDGYKFESKASYTPYESTIDRIEKVLSEKDLAHQMSIIDNVFETIQLNTKEKGIIPENTPLFELSKKPTLTGECSKKAKELLDEIHSRMIVREKGSSSYWPSWKPNNDSLFIPTLTGDSLYDGLSGIALSFLYGAKLFGEEKYLEVVKRTLIYFEAISQDYQGAEIKDMGAFTGVAGIIYYLLKVEKLFPELYPTSLLHLFVEILIKALEKTPEDKLKNMDLISGLSGCLAVWQNSKGSVPGEKYNHLLQKITILLIKKTELANLPEAFNFSTDGQTVLGFSHGVASLAWVFQRVFLDYPLPILYSRISMALKYERSYFNIAQGSWPFLHEGKGIHNTLFSGRQLQSSWCHGGVGIGLARVDMFRKGYYDEIIPYEISIVKRYLEEGNLPSNINLCHGLLGNLELALQMKESSFLDEGTYWRLVEHLLSKIKEGERILCDKSAALANPGLMVGEAGVAYQLMRIIDPALVPSILLLG